MLNDTNQYYDSIRTAHDEEVRPMIQRLLNDLEAKPLVGMMVEGISPETLNSIETTRDFKEKVVSPALAKLLKQTAFSVTSSGKSALRSNANTKYTYISNHRDIVLDPAILCNICLESGLDIPEIAIGDNLLLQPWIKDLVRLSGSFIVKRSPKVREMITESKRLSDYMRRNIQEDRSSQWIAQREGRAKDCNDRTQPALLKMLTMGSDEKDLGKNLAGLNIVPVTITYEYDPCDYLKALELLQKAKGTYRKENKISDLLSMRTGLFGKKGRIHCAFSEPISGFEDVVTPDMNKNEQLSAIAEKVDHQIFLHYRFYPNNYVAYDLTHGGTHFSDMYSRRQRLEFELYIEDQLDKLPVPRSDREFLHQKMLEMYANPLLNNLKTTKRIK